MASPASLVTLASDVLVLSAAVSVAGVGLKLLGSRNMNKLQAPVKATLGGSDSCAEDDELI